MKNLKYIIVLWVFSSCCKDNTNTVYINKVDTLYKSINKAINRINTLYYVFEDSRISKIFYSDNYTYVIKYSSDTINFSYKFYSNSINKTDNFNYVRISKDTIKLTYNYSSINDSGVTFYILKNNLIEKDIQKVGVTNYVYNSDKTIKNINGAINSSYEYIDTIDKISFDNEFYVMSKYYNLDINFKLYKKAIYLDGPKIDTVIYNYNYDDFGNVTKRFRYDTTFYSYIKK
jgi:hypothetical protein